MKEQNFLIANFYCFVRINEPNDLAKYIKEILVTNNILGTVLIAKEGINCALAGLPESLKLSIEKISSKVVKDLDVKFSYSTFMPFLKLKVKVKKEIITFKQDNINPELKTGTMVNAQEWNELILNQEVLVIDTRNSYEVSSGTFKNSVNPHTNHFSDFPQFVSQKLNPKIHKKIAMFCTGGIRCEKASAFLLEQGFDEVFQLNGGILRYLEEVSPSESLWEGNCFVFDARTKSSQFHKQP